MPNMIKTIRHRALDLLARREHSQRELKRKLLQRDFAEPVIDELLTQLIRENLLSDERFAEAYVNMRSQCGYGPWRIQQELRERGVSDALVTGLVNDSSDDWPTRARHVREKRFGLVVPAELKAHAKQIQFLQYRGFTTEQIKQVMHDEE